LVRDPVLPVLAGRALSALAVYRAGNPVAAPCAAAPLCRARALVTLLGAAFNLPVDCRRLGVLAVLGRACWLNAGLALVGLPASPIYGLHEFVLAACLF